MRSDLGMSVGKVAAQYVIYIMCASFDDLTRSIDAREIFIFIILCQATRSSSFSHATLACYQELSSSNPVVCPVAYLYLTGLKQSFKASTTMGAYGVRSERFVR